MFDTHAHLVDPAFSTDLDAVIENARSHGVDHIISVGDNLASCRQACTAVDRYPGLYAAVGIHPHEAGKADEDLAEITKLGLGPKVVAVGETGLDYFRDYATAPAQQSLFRRHIELARQLNKPLVIHTRNSFDDALGILLEGRHHIGVFHCFSGDTIFARKVLDLGYYLSFSGSLTFPKSKLGEVLKMTPRERILLETDAPYLAPVPFRGQRNEPAHVRFVAQQVGAILGLNIDEVDALTTENALRLFRIAPASSAKSANQPA
jgi:TatD DNase family protein